MFKKLGITSQSTLILLGKLWEKRFSCREFNFKLALEVDKQIAPSRQIIAAVQSYYYLRMKRSAMKQDVVVGCEITHAVNEWNGQDRIAFSKIICRVSTLSRTYNHHHSSNI